jgi:threonine synthase
LPNPPTSSTFPPKRYVSTRGTAPTKDFPGVLLAGLAEDGGLYVPESWPTLTPETLQTLATQSYPTIAAHILSLFAGDSIPLGTLQTIANDAYATFRHPAIIPLIQLESHLWSLELFHGPTLAFKDLALQLVGRLFDHVLAERNQRITIVGATSGDTGSAAIEATRGRNRVNIVILHPHNRTSEVQRRQMTTVTAANVKNIAIDGNFDDCQNLVKAMFADENFRDSLNLSAVNSINWARIAGQIPYYVASALALGAPARDIAVSVPTGNFGNVLAAWAARRMGVPIARLTVASNRNDILTRFLTNNDMSVRPVEQTLSPSMDIGVSSNFERLLFDLLGRDAHATAATMAAFKSTGRMEIPQKTWSEAKTLFTGVRLDDEATTAEIRRLYETTGYLADPHTAIGIAAARATALPGIATIAAATAHPAKFPDAIARAVGIRPPLPPHLADLYDRPEHFTTAPNDLPQVQALIRAFATRNAPHAV